MGSRDPQRPLDPVVPGDGGAPTDTSDQAPHPLSSTPAAPLPTLAEVVDALESPAEEYATWADLCEPSGRQRDYVLASGKRVRYTTFVSLEKVARIRMQAMVQGQFDNARFSALLLKEVLVKPRISSDDELRIALKADGVALLDILADVQGLTRAVREMAEKSVGEA